MEQRFISIWFRYLNTDWFSLHQPHLKNLPFVLRTPSHGRMVITGKKEDSLKYANLAYKIKDAIISRYYIPNTGRFDNATQSAQILALWYGISPQKDSSFKILMNEFARHNWHLSTGIFSTMMTFDILRENDMNDIAYRIANQRDYPGWGNMIANGATTLWETWAYPESGPSQNHPMFGSVDEWFYKSLAGINASAPGFKKIIIKPQPAELTWAKGSYRSVYGEIVSDWKKNGDTFELNVEIPANTTATIYIPVKSNQPVTISGGLINAKYIDGKAVIKIGSGKYHFKTKQ